MYTHIVFDVDGTLVDTARVLGESLSRAIREAEGHEPDEQLIREAFGIPSAETLERLQAKNKEEVARLWWKYYAERLDETTLFPGIYELLCALRGAGKKTGIITSKTEEELALDLARLGIDRMFDCRITASDTERHKPDPAPMRAYLARTGAAAEQVLYVGDTIYDCACAAGAGVDFALALWGASTREGIAARYFAAAPEELRKIAGLPG